MARWSRAAARAEKRAHSQLLFGRPNGFSLSCTARAPSAEADAARRPPRLKDFCPAGANCGRRDAMALVRLPEAARLPARSRAVPASGWS